MTRSWGVLIPHTKKSPGAKSPSGVSEYDYAIEMVGYTNLINETRNDKSIYQAYRRLKEKGVNCIIEPHKNAFNGDVSGFELLILEGDKQSEDYAKIIVEDFKKKFPNKRMRGENGIVKLKEGQRGFYNMSQAKKEGMEVAILSEVFFIDNEEDWIEPIDMANFWKGVLV